MEIIKKFVGNQLKRAMKIRDAEPKDLANHLEIEQSNISRWIHGNTLPSEENFAETCHYLEMTPEQLLFPRGELKSDLIVAIVARVSVMDENQLRAVLFFIDGLSASEETPLEVKARQSKD